MPAARVRLKTFGPLSTPRHGVYEQVAPNSADAAAVRLVRPAPQAASGGTPGFIVDSQFKGIGLIETIALGSGAIPPDMGGAASPSYVLQIVNGGVGVYSPQGALLSKLKTDAQFWLQAGIPARIVNIGVSDPRVYWDNASQRFFVTQINVDTPNTIMIAVSRTANPLDGFRATYVTLKGFVLGDFPTLGVNADAVTISTNNFGFFGFESLGIFSIPKADLLQVKPSAARVARFDAVDPVAYGFAVHAVSSQDPSDGNQALLGVSATNFYQLNRSNIIDAGETLAGLSPSKVIFTKYDGNPLLGRQPGGTGYDNSDDRISASIKQVGNYIYFTNTAADPATSAKSSNYVHWGIVDRTTNKIVAEGTVRDPARKIDYSYPAIDANANGRFVIGYNASSATANISAYATICDFNVVAKSVSCTAPKLLAYGVDDNYDLGGTRVRWGDYSSVQVDAANPQAFWLFQEVPGPRQLNAAGVLRARWATVITHFVTQ